MGAVETDERGYTYTSHGNDFKNIKESLRRLWREGKLTKEQEQRLVNLGFEMIPMTKRSVVCYETGELFESVADAARAMVFTNVQFPSPSRIIQHQVATTGITKLTSVQHRIASRELKTAKP